MKRLIPLFLLPLIFAVFAARAQLPIQPLPKGTKTVSTTISLVNHGFAGASGNGLSTIAVTLTGTTAGNLLVAETRWYNDGATYVVPTLSTNNGTSCTVISATVTNRGATAGFGETAIGYCVNNQAGGSVTVTWTWTGHTIGYPNSYVQELSGTTSSPDDGVGNNALGNSTSPSVSTNTAETQNNEYTVSIAETGFGQGLPTTPGSNQILIESGDVASATYQLTSTAGVITHTYVSPSTRWEESIAAFKHY